MSISSNEWKLLTQIGSNHHAPCDKIVRNRSILHQNYIDEHFLLILIGKGSQNLAENHRIRQRLAGSSKDSQDLENPVLICRMICRLTCMTHGFLWCLMAKQ